MLVKTYKSKLEKCVIKLGEPEITEAILEWLIRHGHHHKIERDAKSSQEATTLELYEDNTAEFTITYRTNEVDGGKD